MVDIRQGVDVRLPKAPSNSVTDSKPAAEEYRWLARKSINLSLERRDHGHLYSGSVMCR